MHYNKNAALNVNILHIRTPGKTVQMYNEKNAGFKTLTQIQVVWMVVYSNSKKAVLKTCTNLTSQVKILCLPCKHFLEHRLNNSSYSDRRFEEKLIELFIYVDGYFPPESKINIYSTLRNPEDYKFVETIPELCE